MNFISIQNFTNSIRNEPCSNVFGPDHSNDNDAFSLFINIFLIILNAIFLNREDVEVNKFVGGLTKTLGDKIAI